MRRCLLILALTGSCATTSTEVVAPDDPPIACTLTPGELNTRRDQLLRVLIERAERITELDDGLRIEFASSPGLLAELVRIIDAERECCRFLRFRLTAEPGDGPITFEVTGPPGTRELLRSLGLESAARATRDRRRRARTDRRRRTAARTW